MNMQASATGHPAPEELLAYGDGEAGADVTTHVEACYMCTQRAAEYARTESELRRSLYRFDCPDPHTLGEFQLDLLEPEHRTRVAMHAVECDECRGELQTLRAFLAMPISVPESLVERTRRVVASLLRPMPGLALGGLRGTAPTSTQVYEAGDITVSIGRGSEPNTLTGLVIDPGANQSELTGRQVRLLPNTETTSNVRPITSTIDDLGNFEFADVPSGLYALEIDLLSRLVAIEGLRVD